MVAIQRVLCPTDFSGYSCAARDLALTLAEDSASELVTLHVRPAAGAEPREELARFLAPARGRGIGIGVVVEGDVVDGILESARRWPADLLVMGTHGQRGRRAWGLGSVTERVLRGAPCPVLIVSRPEGAVSGRVPFRRVLCPSDFSEASERALAFAVGLAGGPGVRLTLLHVLEWFPGKGEHAHVNVSEYRLDLAEQARLRLKLGAPLEALRGCEREEVVAVGQPHREILRVARDRGIDLVVLGVHSKRALDRSLAGATVSHVVREATCPVLAVREGPCAGESASAAERW